MKATQHIVNVSGGKDSGSCVLLAHERGIDFRLVMDDTDNEDQQVYDHAHRLAAHVGKPLEIIRADFSQEIAKKRQFIANDRRVGREYNTVQEMIGEDADGKAIFRKRKVGGGRRIRWTNKGKRRALEVLHTTGNAYLDMCLWKGRFPSRMAQFCTEELKVLPHLRQVIAPAIRRWKADEAGPVLVWLGERAEESPKRAAKPRFNRGDLGEYLWRPIKHWTISDVLEIHRRHNFPMNPLYSQGMSRVGCMPCINCRKEEVRQIAARFSQHIDRIERWESLVSRACKRNSATFFPAVTDPTDIDRPGTYSGIRMVVEWSRTTRGGRQFDLLHEMDDTTSGCHSSYGLCE